MAIGEFEAGYLQDQTPGIIPAREKTENSTKAERILAALYCMADEARRSIQSVRSGEEGLTGNPSNRYIIEAWFDRHAVGRTARPRSRESSKCAMIEKAKTKASRELFLMIELSKSCRGWLRLGVGGQIGACGLSKTEQLSFSLSLYVYTIEN